MRYYVPATEPPLGPDKAITGPTSVRIPHEPHLPVLPESWLRRADPAMERFVVLVATYLSRTTRTGLSLPHLAQDSASGCISRRAAGSALPYCGLPVPPTVPRRPGHLLRPDRLHDQRSGRGR
jgi:hypothetical protein